MTLDNLIQYIEEEYPHWNWLVRRNLPDDNYFANILEHRAQLCFPHYDKTAAKALEGSLRAFEAHLDSILPEKRRP